MPTYEQESQHGARRGCMYFAEGVSWSDLATDLSQESIDMIEAPSCAYAEMDARFAYSSPRTIMVTAELNSESDGALFYQGDAVDYAGLYVTAGQVIAIHNGAAAMSLVLTSDPANRTYHIAWITEENPDTAGPDDAYVSWIVAWDVNGGVAIRSLPFIHGTNDAPTDLACWGARDAAGLNAFDGSITRVGFHHRALTLSEIHDDYVAAAGLLTTGVNVERPQLPLTLAAGLGARDDLHGPVYAWAASQHHQLRRRTSTGRTIRCEPIPITVDWHAGNPRVRLAPQSTSYRMVLGWHWPLPVQPVHSHIWVRVHATITGSVMNPIAPVGLRAYSSNKPPQLAVPGGEAYDQTYRGDTVARNDVTPTNGEWTLDELVPIKRGTEGLREGWTYVSLAYALFPDVGLSDPTLRANVVQLVPCSVPIDDGGEIGGFQEGA